MQNDISLRIELGLPQNKIMHHLMLHNEEIERQIAAGMDEALKDLDIKELTRNAVKKDIESVLWSVSSRWDLKEKLRKAIDDKMKEVLDTYVEKIAAQMREQLNLPE